MDPLSQLQDEQKKRFARMKMKEAIVAPEKVSFGQFFFAYKATVPANQYYIFLYKV